MREIAKAIKKAVDQLEKLNGFMEMLIKLLLEKL